MLKKIRICMCMIIVLTLSLTSYSFAATATVDTKVLNVRNEPSQSGTKIGSIKNGQEFEILDKSNEWIKINLNNSEGWISSKYVDIKEDTTISNEKVNNEGEKKILKKVNTSTLNIRAGNSSSSQKIGNLKFGAEVQVLETINNWDRIILDSLTGWVCNDYLVNVAQEDINDTKSNEQKEITVLKTAVINTSTLNVRENSSTDSNRLGTLKKNAIVAIIGEENGWYKIKYNNKYGYILSDYTINKDIEISRGSYSRGERPTTIAETATTLALQYIGCKYVWGGTSPNGFDCSGLVYYVYKDYVPNLGRSAKPQSKTGTTIEKENLVMGDLVFFGENGGSTVTHVGIYVADGIFVHAANSKRGVVTDTIFSGYYDKNYLYAKRIA